MSEPANVGRSVSPLPVTNRDLDNLQILLRGTKKEIEVSERIEVAKIGPTLGNAFVVGSIQNLRAAQRVFDRLT